MLCLHDGDGDHVELLGPRRLLCAWARHDPRSSRSHGQRLSRRREGGAGDAFMTRLIDKLWDVALLGGHRRDQLRNISTDVLREVLKVAALSVALTVARPGAAYRIGPPAIGRPTGSPGTERSASSCSRNHCLSGTTWVA